MKIITTRILTSFEKESCVNFFFCLVLLLEWCQLAIVTTSGASTPQVREARPREGKSKQTQLNPLSLPIASLTYPFTNDEPNWLRDERDGGYGVLRQPRRLTADRACAAQICRRKGTSRGVFTDREQDHLASWLVHQLASRVLLRPPRPAQYLGLVGDRRPELASR